MALIYTLFVKGANNQGYSRGHLGQHPGYQVSNYNAFTEIHSPVYNQTSELWKVSFYLLVFFLQCLPFMIESR